MVLRYLLNLFKSIEFTNLYWSTYRPKGDVCRQLGVDILIDDYLEHALAAAECGIEVLLFGDYPWNRADGLPICVRRVRDWSHVADVLLKDEV